ncbi:28644_t:CDS:2, partial [Racocetra persica]
RKKKPTIKETNAGGICLYCGQEIDLYNLKNTDIDHIIPQSRIGFQEGMEGFQKAKNELEDFVSRNLNDTRMIATYLARYIQNELNKKEEFRTKIATKETK